MRKREKRMLLKNLSFASAVLMFISLLGLIVIGQPVITGQSISISISGINAQENPLGVITAILISTVIVAAILFLGSKTMENRI